MNVVSKNDYFSQKRNKNTSKKTKKIYIDKKLFAGLIFFQFFKFS